MAQERLGGRVGLASISDGTREQYSLGDINQAAYRGIALAALIAELTGGPGRYVGGAEDETDLGAGGTTYPAVGAWVVDRGGVLWPILSTAPKAITFDATDGAVNVYAVIEAQAGSSPPAAIGGLDSFEVIAQAAADAAPLDGLLLGTGTATGSALTAYTAEAVVIWPPLPTAADVGADPAGTAATAVADHVAEADPHTQYQRESEKGAANGYAPLGATAVVPLANLPTGSGNGLDADTVDGNHASAFATAAALTGHTGNTSNPHSTTASQLGIGNVYGEIYPTADYTIANYAGSPHFLDFTTNWTRTLTGLSWSSGDPTKIAILSSGLYQLDMCLSWGVNATGYRIGGWDINGTMQPRICAAVTGQYTSSQQAMTVRLTAGQYLRVGCWQNSGGDLVLRGFSTITRLYIARIAP